MSRGLKVGLIGLGSMGSNYLRILSLLPGISLVGVSDLDPARLAASCEQYHVAAFPNYLELLPKASALFLVTPTATHHQIAKECLLAGKHLLVEKPFTGSSSLAKELIFLAKEKNLILSVDLIEYFNPAFLKLLKLLKGEKIHGLEFKRFSPFPERITDTDVIFDMMFHDLGLLPFLYPDEIEQVKSEGEKLRSKKLDRVVATIYHKSGTISRFDSNRVFGSKTRIISVTTDKYLIEADLLNKTIYLRDFSSPVPSTIPVKPSDQLTDLITNFVLAVKGKKPLKINGEAGLAAVLLAERIEEAC